MGWQWHQLDHMQIICTLLQTDNHVSTSPLSFYRPDSLPATQPTASKHWRQWHFWTCKSKTVAWISDSFHRCGVQCKGCSFIKKLKLPPQSPVTAIFQMNLFQPIPLGSLPHLSQNRIFEDSSTGIFTDRCPSYHPINGEEALEEMPVLPNLQPLMPLFMNWPTAINKWVCCWKLDEQMLHSCASRCSEASTHTHTHMHATILWPFFRDYWGEPVPEEIFQWCKGK